MIFCSNATKKLVPADCRILPSWPIQDSGQPTWVDLLHKLLQTNMDFARTAPQHAFNANLKIEALIIHSTGLFNLFHVAL